MPKPLVTICCITYNQEEFIGEAIDGFIMQDTNFSFEVIISDDKSTDGTRDIILSYANKYPDIIKPIFNEKNIGSLNNYRDNFLRARGKYIAMCEGDDYWTDPSKLQKQVDFMENNPDSALCFHPVVIHFEEGENEDSVFPDVEDVSSFTLDKLLEGNFIQTNSVMYRRQEKYELAETDFVPGDWYLHLYHARLGKIGFINSVMAVYRKHNEGMWAGDHGRVFWDKYAIRHLEFCNQLLKMFDSEETSKKQVIVLSSRILYEVDKHVGSDSDLMRNIQKLYPNFILEYTNFLKQNIEDLKHVINDKDAYIENITNKHNSIKSLAKILTHKIYVKISNIFK